MSISTDVGQNSTVLSLHVLYQRCGIPVAWKMENLQAVLNNRYKRLFWSLILLLVSLAWISEKTFLTSLTLQGVFLTAILAAVDTFKVAPASRNILRGLAAFLFFSVFLATPFKIDRFWFIFLEELATLIFLSISSSVILRKIFSEQKVTGDTIRIGISVYLMLGLVWLTIYRMLVLFDPQAFSRPVTLHQLVYFSFITLTSTGYGDIHPVSQTAMILATSQAIVGQMYVAITIARLVSLYGHHPEG